MTGKNIVGIIFSNAYDECIPELTGLRTMGSVPFACRYRLIDFPLSNMVNAGIEKVGVITKANYQSLMDHLGTGKPWDLSRKTGGLFLLPPFLTADANGNGDKLESLKGIKDFVSRSTEEYVILSDSNSIFNVDIEELMDFHTGKNADITIAYKHGIAPKLNDTLVMKLDGYKKINYVAVNPQIDGEVDYSLNLMLMKKSLLERLMNEAVSLNHTDFGADIIQKNVSKLNMFGFPLKGYARTIDSIQTYFKANMDLLDTENCAHLFNSERPIYTKIKDDMPATYGLSSSIKNSLVANGCIIEGEVENSIIFRDVRIEKGAVVKNSIIMQESFIAQGTSLNNAIIDKNVVITPNKTLSGAENYPIYVGKGIVV